MAVEYDERKYKKIAVLENIMEADIAKHILKDAAIPHYIRDMDDSAYGNVYQSVHGFAQIWAPEEYRERIEQLLAELRQAAPVYEDE